VKCGGLPPLQLDSAKSIFVGSFVALRTDVRSPQAGSLHSSEHSRAERCSLTEMTRLRISIALVVAVLASSVPLSAERKGLVEALASSPAARKRVARPSELPAKLDALLATHLARPLPGFSVTVMRGDSVIYAKGMGYSNVANSTAVWSESMFQVGSVTKQFTAAAIMRLAEQGKLSVDDEVTKYIPELPTRGNVVRLRHLMNHTSGLPEYTPLLPDPYRPLPLDAMINLIKDKPMQFAPGAGWAYGNTGFYLLAAVIERVSGKSYGAFLRDELTAPLGLLNTGYCGSSPQFTPPSGYLELYSKGAFTSVNAIEPSNAFGAGGLCSTGTDLVRWSKALAGGRVVSTSSYASMTAPTRYGGSGLVGYGYGLSVGSMQGRRAIEHGGSILGFESYLGHLPAEDLTIAVLVNVTIVPGEGIAAKIANDVAALVLAAR